MKKLAIIGKPNVGKSSFFNRILKERDAITSEQAGTTRDIKKRSTKILGRDVQVLDTGGLDQGCELFDKIKEMSLKAAYSADIILYMVDGKSLPEEDDKKFFYELEKLGKKVALVVNKIDNDKMNEKIWEYYEFGTDNVFGISVAHNRSINKLLEWVASHLPEPILEEDTIIEPALLDENLEDDEDYISDEEYFGDEEKEDNSIYYEENDIIKEFDETTLDNFKVAIIGRVNVGKSSLLNALLNEERSVVSSVAGTTIDPIDETIEYKNKNITFVDTAGIRRRGKILGIEKFALMRTQKMLDDADIALLILDASDPFLDLDEKIAGLIDQNRLGCVIVLNKWDISDAQEYDKRVQDVRDRFRFLHYAPIITISAQTKLRVNKLLDLIIEINENFTQRIPTSKLNEVISFAQRKHSLPSMNGAFIRIYYATQYETRPPRIALMMNKPKGLHFTYRRYLTNQVREAFNFTGVPLLFKVRGRKEKF